MPQLGHLVVVHSYLALRKFLNLSCRWIVAMRSFGCFLWLLACRSLTSRFPAHLSNLRDRALYVVNIVSQRFELLPCHLRIGGSESWKHRRDSRSLLIGTSSSAL